MSVASCQQTMFQETTDATMKMSRWKKQIQVNSFQKNYLVHEAQTCFAGRYRPQNPQTSYRSANYGLCFKEVDSCRFHPDQPVAISTLY